MPRREAPPAASNHERRLHQHWQLLYKTDRRWRSTYILTTMLFSCCTFFIIFPNIFSSAPSALYRVDLAFYELYELLLLGLYTKEGSKVVKMCHKQGIFATGSQSVSQSVRPSADISALKEISRNLGNHWCSQFFFLNFFCEIWT